MASRLRSMPPVPDEMPEWSKEALREALENGFGEFDGVMNEPRDAALTRFLVQIAETYFEQGQPLPLESIVIFQEAFLERETQTPSREVVLDATTHQIVGLLEYCSQPTIIATDQLGFDTWNQDNILKALETRFGERLSGADWAEKWRKESGIQARQTCAFLLELAQSFNECHRHDGVSLPLDSVLIFETAIRLYHGFEPAYIATHLDMFRRGSQLLQVAAEGRDLSDNTPEGSWMFQKGKVFEAPSRTSDCIAWILRANDGHREGNSFF